MPSTARRAKPFIDHILTFSIVDSKIWFRNFQVRHCANPLGRGAANIYDVHPQILAKDPLQPNGPAQTTLVEIGPRFVLTPIRIFEGAFGGATVFSNPGACASAPLSRRGIARCCTDAVTHFAEFVTPAATRQALKREKGNKYNNRKDAEEESARRREQRRLGEDALGVSKVFA